MSQKKELISPYLAAVARREATPHPVWKTFLITGEELTSPARRPRVTALGIGGGWSCIAREDLERLLEGGRSVEEDIDRGLVLLEVWPYFSVPDADKGNPRGLSPVWLRMRYLQRRAEYDSISLCERFSSVHDYLRSHECVDEVLEMDECAIMWAWRTLREGGLDELEAVYPLLEGLQGALDTGDWGSQIFWWCPVQRVLDALPVDLSDEDARDHLDEETAVKCPFPLKQRG